MNTNTPQLIFETLFVQILHQNIYFRACRRTFTVCCTVSLGFISKIDQESLVAVAVVGVDNTALQHFWFVQNNS